jgi:hypothetical protein
MHFRCVLRPTLFKMVMGTERLGHPPNFHKTGRPDLAAGGWGTHKRKDKDSICGLLCRFGSAREAAIWFQFSRTACRGSFGVIALMV